MGLPRRPSRPGRSASGRRPTDEATGAVVGRQDARASRSSSIAGRRKGAARRSTVTIYSPYLPPAWAHRAPPAHPCRLPGDEALAALAALLPLPLRGRGGGRRCPRRRGRRPLPPRPGARAAPVPLAAPSLSVLGSGTSRSSAVGRDAVGRAGRRCAGSQDPGLVACRRSGPAAARVRRPGPPLGRVHGSAAARGVSRPVRSARLASFAGC